jgi:mono/diheme cytochrome c family protein
MPPVAANQWMGIERVSVDASAGKLTRFGLAALAVGVAINAAAFMAAPSVAAGAISPAQIKQGRQLFNDWSCGTCHALKDAGASGPVGPSLNNPKMTRAFVINRITNGAGAMPGFGGQMSDAEIATLSDYIVHASKK